MLEESPSSPPRRCFSEWSTTRVRHAPKPTTCNEAGLAFLSLCWGVVPVLIPPADSSEDVIRFSIEAARRAGYVESGQQVIITGGAPLHIAGKTNFIRVDRVN